jgi:poly-beta-1,6-N-acetyl-D-glucosamine synthase
MNNASYVLVTPARNEQATVEITIQSVLAQTLRPREWIIVSDGSTDRTDEIVARYASAHPFISLLRLDDRGSRSFASVVFATEAGYKALKTRDYDYIGLLDSDVRFKPDYFANLIQRFEANPRLGIGGGLVLDVVQGKLIPSPPQNLKEIAGATQFFRRACFESLGGLTPIPEGGWDAITSVQARRNGYETQTFPELVVDHLKFRSGNDGHVFRRRWKMGARDYALGNDPLFQVFKCVFRAWEPPLLIGSLIRFCGYAWCALTRRARHISPELVAVIRAEQRARLWPWK